LIEKGSSPLAESLAVERIAVVDTHTEGEPTRVVVDGWGDRLTGTTMAARRDELRQRHDALRRALVTEPRGHEAVVGALLTPPVAAGSAAGVVFFDNVGYLGMCGHGTIGVARTLDFLGRLPATPGNSGAASTVRLDTPAGTVTAEISGVAVTITNVPARCLARDVVLEVPGLGKIAGDVAYGGNWFFLTTVEQLPGLTLARDQAAQLTAATWRIRTALAAAGVTGEDGAEIDHIEVFGPPTSAGADSRNFVLCPGGAFDRSPCGTGTSAKLAVLHARGEIALGERWHQESFVGGHFTAWLSRDGAALVPHIRGRAFVTAQATLIFERDDPFRAGFPLP
jgi:4-hydroxyproline epimerase